jgi:demethylspheroidene O-methyltransferase
MKARGLMSLLFHAEKALDLVQTALDLGVLERLDAGPATLDELCAASGARPLRMYKFMDGLESLGLVERRQPSDALASSSYVTREPLAPAARSVLAADSIERDRDRYPWRDVRGHLPVVLRGDRSADFAWPPETPDAVASFETSMSAGCPPLVETFAQHSMTIFHADAPLRWLDVGGGDGTLVAGLLPQMPNVSADVFNLPATEPLVKRRMSGADLLGRIGFVGGDFLRDPLPSGYDVISFVRVLHDWPAEVARTLVTKAYAALPIGGHLVICEEFRTRERLAVQFFWTYFLIGVDACVSRLREVEWYTRVLADVGFEEIRVLPGAFEIVLARKNR